MRLTFACTMIVPGLIALAVTPLAAVPEDKSFSRVTPTPEIWALPKLDPLNYGGDTRWEGSIQFAKRAPQPGKQSLSGWFVEGFAAFETHGDPWLLDIMIRVLHKAVPVARTTHDALLMNQIVTLEANLLVTATRAQAAWIDPETAIFPPHFQETEARKFGGSFVITYPYDPKWVREKITDVGLQTKFDAWLLRAAQCRFAFHREARLKDIEETCLRDLSALRAYDFPSNAFVFEDIIKGAGLSEVLSTALNKRIDKTIDRKARHDAARARN